MEVTYNFGTFKKTLLMYYKNQLDFSQNQISYFLIKIGSNLLRSSCVQTQYLHVYKKVCVSKNIHEIY